MPQQRKLGRPTDQRVAILRGLVTALLTNGRIETTEARAREVKNITESLIALAIREADKFSSKQIKISAAKVDSTGKKITKSVTSKNNRKYEVVERAEKTDMITVDNPSRLHARRQIIKWVNRVKDENGKQINVVDKLFDEIAPKYKDRNGGYTRIYKLGPRRGDAAERVILELV
ncbi:MAG TPA: 50S ribosomal protein L17 [Clostridiales bacterium]|nr:50S ribosomal protein L17 [Clostridiales bacterium]